MNESPIHRIVTRAVSEARTRGEDYLGQTESAVRAVLAVETDLTASEALQAVKRVREALD